MLARLTDPHTWIFDLRESATDSPDLALYNAVKHQRLQQAKRLLEEKADPNFAEPESGCRTLIQAVLTDNKKQIELLLEHKADLDTRNARNGCTALHYAAWNGKCKMIELLLDSGADESILSNRELTALDYAKWAEGNAKWGQSKRCVDLLDRSMLSRKEFISCILRFCPVLPAALCPLIVDYADSCYVRRTSLEPRADILPWVQPVQLWYPEHHQKQQQEQQQQHVEAPDSPTSPPTLSRRSSSSRLRFFFTSFNQDKPNFLGKGGCFLQLISEVESEW
eukprot:g61030.t1